MLTLQMERRPQGKIGQRRPGSFRPFQREKADQDTSWEKSAGWYDRIIGEKGSNLYQGVVMPRTLELLAPNAGESVLDLGCGQGVLARSLAERGCKVTGVDLSPALIKRARTYRSARPIEFIVRDASEIGDLGPFDALTAVLSLQNMEHLPQVCAACAKALRPGGRMVWVMNHPCFRIPRQSAWGFDEGRKIQYRRVDAYSTPMQIPILMHPGQKESEQTVSFHHSLADLCEPAFAAGFCLAGLEEWHSNRQSEPGGRARAENRARREFPLFLALLWRRAAAPI